MNWMLNDRSRAQIDAMLQEQLSITDPAVGAAQAQLVAHLRQARSWMQQMK